MTTKHEPADPCRAALRTLVDAPKTNQPGKYQEFADAVDKAQAALATPNPMPALVQALEDLLRESYDGHGLRAPHWDSVEQAQAALKLAKGER